MTNEGHFFYLLYNEKHPIPMIDSPIELYLILHSNNQIRL